MTRPPAADFASRRLGALTRGAWTLLIVGTFVVALDSVLVGPGRDSSAFIYVAEGLLAGELPYLDRWDHKGPLIYALNAGALSLAGVPGIWLLNAAFLAASAWLAFRTATNAFGTAAALPALALFLAYFASFGGGGNLTEGYALTFQLLALFLFTWTCAHQDDQRRLIWACLAIGMLGALAFLLRPNLIGIWFAIGVFWAVKRGACLKLLVWSCVGGIGALSVASVLLVVSGSWHAMWDAYIAYNFAYVDSSLTDKLKAFAALANSLNILAPLLALGWLIGFYYLATGRARHLPFNSVLFLAAILGRSKWPSSSCRASHGVTTTLPFFRPPLS